MERSEKSGKRSKKGGCSQLNPKEEKRTYVHTANGKGGEKKPYRGQKEGQVLPLFSKEKKKTGLDTCLKKEKPRECGSKKNQGAGDKNPSRKEVCKPQEESWHVGHRSERKRGGE